MTHHIEYLLSRHDCVVVPGLGAFLNLYQPARYDEATMTFHAPEVTIGFNPAINHNDWMLADSISRREKCSREYALNLISDEVKALLYQLESDGEVALGKIGRLKQSEGLTPLFEPSDSQFLCASAGLFDVNIAPISSEAADTAEQDFEEPKRTPLILRLSRVAAAIAAVVVGALFLYKAYENPAGGDTHFASIDSNFRSHNVTEVITDEPAVTAQPELLIALRHDDCTAPVKKEFSAGISDINLNLSDRYLLIVASFSSPGQAERFMAEHKSTPLKVLDADDTYRVVAATAPSLAEMVKMSENPEITKAFAQSWVLRR